VARPPLHPSGASFWEEAPTGVHVIRDAGISLRARAFRSAQPCCGLNLLKRRLVESYTTVIIPFDDGVIFVCLLNRAEFSIRLSEVAQTLDAISRIQFLVGGRGPGERWPLGTV
jgi:hypothetical protein